jgi:5'-nucleotidase
VIELNDYQMQILVTNDDGIFSPGLWALVAELKSIARVVVVAPDREQSASGTAVSLRHPLRVQKISPVVPGVEAYSVEGTPCDSVILALGKLIKDDINLLVSGINRGNNLGDDILISGTVGAALQGYLRGLPALAISVAITDNSGWENATRLTKLLALRIETRRLPTDIFLNINLPGLPLARIKGIKIAHPAHKTHIDTVEEGHDGRHKYYWLIRQKQDNHTDTNTDIQVLENGYVSLTALHNTIFRKASLGITDSLCSELFRELKRLK